MDADRQLLSDHDKARNLINAEFGAGARTAHEALRNDPMAKRIYDCAVEALARSINNAREEEEARTNFSSNAIRQTTAFLTRWNSVAADREVAPGLTFGDLRDLLGMARREQSRF